MQVIFHFYRASIFLFNQLFIYHSKLHFRVKLVESEFTLETVRNSLSINKHLISPSNLQTFNASPDEHLKEVLNIAQKDLDALRNKFQLVSYDRFSPL